MIYQFIIAYFTVKFLGELLFGDDNIPETDIRQCNCSELITREKNN